MPIRRVLLCLLTILAAASLAAEKQPERFSGKVVGVSDGDTISVMREGRAVKIRLNGIDCPEKGQDFGAKAKSFTSDACFGKPVTVKVFD